MPELSPSAYGAPTATANHVLSYVLSYVLSDVEGRCRRASRRVGLERVHLRPQGRDPVGGERFLDELLLQAGHVGRGEVDSLSRLAHRVISVVIILPAQRSMLPLCYRYATA